MPSSYAGPSKCLLHMLVRPSAFFSIQNTAGLHTDVEFSMDYSAAFQPLFGQLANIFGRRWVTLCIVATFTLGSGICGGAKTGGMLIAGRAVQGVGSGGMQMIIGMFCVPG